MNLIFKTTLAAVAVFAADNCALWGADYPAWRMIYSNDTTNVLNCASAYNDLKQPREMTERKIRESVREAVVEGMDAQLIQPAHSWVPWWNSKLVPLAEHEQWFREHYGVEPNLAEHRYLLAGGDIIGPFIDECHKNKVAALVSFRANDAHHLEYSFDEKLSGGDAHSMTRFYVEHPQYRLGPLSSRNWKDCVHNWAIPEARAYKEALIAEVIEIYPQMDGMEIDFLRHPFYFKDDLPLAERSAIMCGFLKKVRAELDKAQQKVGGQRRVLGVRVPTEPQAWRDVGFVPADWAKVVDYFNLSPSYDMSQQTGVAQARAEAPNTRIYEELTHTTMTWRLADTAYDQHQYRRSTHEMLENTARLAYARGADGVSFFNFAYYRAHGGKQNFKGPFNEPPFAFLPKLIDKAALEKIDGYFYVRGRDLVFNSKRKTRDYTMDILPANGNGPATLRILAVTEKERPQSELEPIETGIQRGNWVVELNGKRLTQTKNTMGTYPFDSEIKSGFNKAEQYLSFLVPSGALKDGDNVVRVVCTAATRPMHLRWIEIIQPSK